MKQLLFTFLSFYLLTFNNFGQDSDSYFDKASKYLKDGKYSQAIIYYNYTIKASPRLAEAYFLRGLAKEMTKDFSGALMDYRKAMYLNSELLDYFIEGITTDDFSPTNHVTKYNSDYDNPYLAIVKSKTLVHSDPKINSEKLTSLSKGSYVFIGDSKIVNGFYQVYDILTDTEGWVDKSEVKLIQRVDLNEKSLLEAVQSYESHLNPTIKIFNDTKKNITVKIGSTSYYYKPGEIKTIELSPGKYKFFASAYGVLPDISYETLQAGYLYSLKYIIIKKEN